MDETVSNSDKELLDQLKELDDLEFEIMFIDNICKKLRSLVYNEVRTATQLFMYMSVIDATKKYCSLAKESGRSILHEDAVNLIISKGEGFLKMVADNESKAHYANKSLTELHEIVKELLFTLKRELVSTPKYEYLKPLGLE